MDFCHEYIENFNFEPDIKRFLTIRIQHPGNVEVLLGDVEGRVQILQWIVLAELVVVDEIGTVTMDQGAERQTVLERQMEVLDVDVLVGGGLALTPEQETFLGGHLLDRDVLDGESQNDRPYHTQGHFEIAIDDFWKEEFSLNVLGL